ncbi:MAG: putative aminopeptidase [Burkholderiaceae bacterium]|jgi:predicted aminopeptidase
MKWHMRIVVAATAMLVSGCAQIDYYYQAAQGQFALLAGSRPIDDWLADPEVGEKLKARLTKVREIRRYAARELGLPDNNSYTNYADVKRPYVLWNVVATPELSMKPAQWCFPIAGCVNYRGYYNKQEALDYAAVLRRAGYDVHMSGVAAYSTLGWFNDPVLSTFIQYPDGELARLVFHELAHQVAYARDDTQFNESFATTVEELGVERWMAAHGDAAMRENFQIYDGRKRDFLGLLLKYRKQLAANYARTVSDREKRSEKSKLFAALKDEYLGLKTAWGGYAGYDRWFAEPLSNAHLASVASYHDYVPAFRALMTEQKTLSKFYNATRKMASLEPLQRNMQLAQLTRNASLASINAPIKR